MQENFRSPQARHFFLVGRKKNPNLLEIRMDQVIHYFFPSIPHGSTGAKKVLLFRRPVTRRLCAGPAAVGQALPESGARPHTPAAAPTLTTSGERCASPTGCHRPVRGGAQTPAPPGLLTSLTSVLIKRCLTLLFEHATHPLREPPHVRSGQSSGTPSFPNSD